MKNLAFPILAGLIIAGCGSASPANVNSPTADGAASAPRPLSVTAGPPGIPIGPIQGNPLFPGETPTPVEGWRTFNDAALAVAVDYPGDWSVTERSTEAVFTSPQGATITLQDISAGQGQNEAAAGGGQCSTLNNYGLSVNACTDAAADRYSATYRIKSADGTTRILVLSTLGRQALDVYKGMLGSLRSAG